MTRPIDDPTPAGVRPLLEQAIGTLAPTLPLLTDLGARFRDAGHELALVGGPVRDAFLQRTPPDLDFTTSASPDETEAILRSWGSATWDMGREFGTIGAVRRDSGGETTHLSKWAGLGKTSPVLAGSFAVFMLSFAGIPLTGGFIGKWGVFSAAYSGGFWWLVVIGVLVSALAAYFYVRVIVLMFFTDPVGEGPTVAVPSVMTTVVIVVAVVGTVGLGIIPGPLLDLAQHAGAFVR
jgi:NADH:ubiquinone oxidoreductase subunit 2 (subunit N)